jgi:hypothetical protein
MSPPVPPMGRFRCCCSPPAWTTPPDGTPPKPKALPVTAIREVAQARRATRSTGGRAGSMSKRSLANRSPGACGGCTLVMIRASTSSGGATACRRHRRRRGQLLCGNTFFGMGIHARVTPISVDHAMRGLDPVLRTKRTPRMRHRNILPGTKVPLSRMSTTSGVPHQAALGRCDRLHKSVDVSRSENNDANLI